KDPPKVDPPSDPPVEPKDDPPPDPKQIAEKKQREIDTAIDKGIRFLRSQATPSGTWVDPDELEIILARKAAEGLQGLKPKHYVGYAALPALALLECKVPAEDPAIQRAAKFIRTHAPKLTMTYDLGLCVVFLDRLGDPQDKPLI